MTEVSADAVVVGAGHNGLVAACMLADAGWDVCVLERADEVGGAMRSEELAPGHVTDLYSAFYPMAAASPYLRSLRLEEHGLRWSHAPAVLAHVAGPAMERAAVMHRDPEQTAARLDEESPGDGEAWLDLVRQWRVLREPFLEALFTPFPPLRGPVSVLRRIGTRDALRLARLLALPMTRLGPELFTGEHAPMLIAGNAMHADIPAVAPGSGAFGWLLSMIGQDLGYPVPVGGSSEFARALAARARAAGAQVRTGCPVAGIEVSGARATGVRTATGERVRARRAVLADVAAPALYHELLPADAVPARLRQELDRMFTWDLPTVKVNWALDGRVPWRAEGAGQAGTVHLGAGLDGLAVWSAAADAGVSTEDTFVLLGQMAVADASRAPAGAETVWAYSHLPRGTTGTSAARGLAERMEGAVESLAPGFRDRVKHRVVQMPDELETDDPNLVGGAVNGGTAQLFQQLVFRPLPGLGRPETPVTGLYLASAGAHPGGGVHGGPGGAAARAALHGHRLGGLPARALSTASRWLAG